MLVDLSPVFSEINGSITGRYGLVITRVNLYYYYILVDIIYNKRELLMGIAIIVRSTGLLENSSVTRSTRVVKQSRG